MLHQSYIIIHQLCLKQKRPSGVQEQLVENPPVVVITASLWDCQLWYGNSLSMKTLQYAQYRKIMYSYATIISTAFRTLWAERDSDTKELLHEQQSNTPWHQLLVIAVDALDQVLNFRLVALHLCLSRWKRWRVGWNRRFVKTLKHEWNSWSWVCQSGWPPNPLLLRNILPGSC